MGNTNMDALFPEFWFASFDSLDIGKYSLQNRVSRDVENQLARSGDTVNVPITPDLQDADDWTPGSTIVATAIAQEVVPVVLNKSKRKTIGLTGSELSLSPYDLIQRYGTPLAKTILRSVNQAIYLELLKTRYVYDKRSAFSEDDVVDMKTTLSNNEVGDTGRSLVAGPDDIGAMLKLDAFQHANVSGDDGKAMESGLVQTKFGFGIFEENIIQKYTPADVAGIVGSAGALLGATTMPVSGFDDDTRPIREGDVFTVATETGTPLHSIKKVTYSSGDSVAFEFTPPLASAVSSGDGVTIIPSRSILGFHPGACAFAARAYAELPVGVKSAVFNHQGLPIRIVVWVDSGTLNVNVQYDILFGAKIINEKRVVRILRG